jgi:DNA/RNA endonuclease YhcR with UshA esterase domain
MRNSYVCLCLFAVLLLSSSAAPVSADDSVAKKRVAHPSRYDANKEVTLEGTVESLTTKPVTGKMLGGHLMVATPKGTVDGQIGGYVLRGSHAFTATPGEKVKITGVMTTFHGQQAFLVRTIQTPDRTVVVRDAHGFFVLPGVREHVTRTSTQGGAR